MTSNIEVVLRALAHLPASCRHRPKPQPGDPRATCCATGGRASDARDAIAALARITDPDTARPRRAEIPPSDRFRGGLNL